MGVYEKVENKFAFDFSNDFYIPVDEIETGESSSNNEDYECGHIEENDSNLIKHPIQIGFGKRLQESLLPNKM